ADVLVVVADDFHMLADLAEQTALVLAALPPASEVVLELRLPLGAVFVIVAVELAQMPVAPGPILRILVARAVGPVAGPCAAGAAIFIARPRAVRAAIVAGHRAIVAAAIAEAVAIAAEELAAPTAVIVLRARSAAGKRAAIVVPVAAVAVAVQPAFAIVIARAPFAEAFALVAHAVFAPPPLGLVV